MEFVLSIIVLVIIGALIGWHFPQPSWIKDIEYKVEVETKEVVAEVKEVVAEVKAKVARARAKKVT